MDAPKVVRPNYEQLWHTLKETLLDVQDYRGVLATMDAMERLAELNAAQEVRAWLETL